MAEDQKENKLIVGVLAERGNETRVALLPDGVKDLNRVNASLWVEKGAGNKAYAPDQEYENAGAVVTERQEVINNADILVGINPPSAQDAEHFREGQVWISLMNTEDTTDVLEKINESKVTALALEQIPRTSRAQMMDVLSSQANIAGYKASLLAAANLPRFFPMLTTAAGSIPPSKVLVLGAGVAGLQAIATARRLGAVVEAFDVRPAVKEEVESLGATFVEVEGSLGEDESGYAAEQIGEFLNKQQQVLEKHAAKADVIITTAQIPGKKAPVLIPGSTVEQMKPGSVIVDLAAASGGNCELTQDQETVVRNEVTIIGDSNIAASLPRDASKMFGRNITELLRIMVKDGALNLDFEDDILNGCCIAHGGGVNTGKKQVEQ